MGNIEQGTKTLGQALGLAAQPVTPGFSDQDQDQQTAARFAKGVGLKSNIAGGSKQLGSTEAVHSTIASALQEMQQGRGMQQGVTITITPGVSPTTPSAGPAMQNPGVGPAVQSPSVGGHSPLINPLMPGRNPLAGPTAPVVTSGNQPGGLIGAIRQLTHTPATKEPRYTTITGAPTDNPLACSVNSVSKRQLADVSGIEDAGQSSAEKGLSV